MAFSWEQRKLGEVGTITSGFMGDSLLSDGKYHLTRIETIADGTVDENRIGYSVRKPDDIYLLKYGDILYSNINSISHMGKVAKYQGKTPLYHGINLLRLEPIQTINSDFMLYLLNTDKCRNWAKTRANQAVSQASINQSLLATQEIKICSTNEQQKIGQYFSRLDKLITLHQRKLDRLKNIKKSMLDKMFPKDGEVVPEIRFKGFTDAWEQRKLGEIADRYDNLRIPVAANLRISGSTPYYGANGIQDYVDGYTHEGEFILVAEDGANDLKNYPVKSVKGRIWVNNHAHVLQGKNEIADNKFLAFAISQADIESLLVGGGRAKLNAEALMEINLLLPEKQEQVSIGNYFVNLDNLITLHQRKSF